MKKEEFVAGLVMTIVSTMVLVGVTIAWFADDITSVFSKGMSVSAAELSSVRIALESNGEDINDLAADDIIDNEYADIGLAALTNIETGKMAPGAFGKVTFYVKPEKGVVECNIEPRTLIQQGEDAWYPDMSDITSGADGNGSTGGTNTDGTLTIETLYGYVQEHISFYSDEAMTKIIDKDNPYVIEWTSDENANEDVTQNTEKTVTIYWKWHYENPLADGESDVVKKKELIDEYDKEDTIIGKNVSRMKFNFSFFVQ